MIIITANLISLTTLYDVALLIHTEFADNLSGKIIFATMNIPDEDNRLVSPGQVPVDRSKQPTRLKRRQPTGYMCLFLSDCN